MPISTDVPRRILSRISRSLPDRSTGSGTTGPNAAVTHAKHFVVTWAIPDNYGGMTNALFHRSRALSREAGLNVTVLTFDWRSSYDAAREALQRRGALTKGVELLNMWEWLADLDDRQLRALGDKQSRDEFKPLEAAEAPKQDRRHRRRCYSSDGKTLLQQDYYRQDGSLLASDRFDVAVTEGKKAARRIFICDSSGKPVRTLTSAAALYHLWLDQLTAGDEAFVVVDSKFAADFIAQYRRANVATMYMVHGAHTDWRIPSPYAPLSRVRRDAFAGLERFAGVVLLTDRQKFHTALRLGDFGNLTVIPNSWNPSSKKVEAMERDESRGIIVASLDNRKQVDHAIRAVSALNSQEEISPLHIFGSGSQAESLDQLIRDQQMQESIHLEGFTNDVAGEFAKSSYSLLTSHSEGLPLVILESMAMGCVPICYDMNYGPSQVIDHGVNGFLVPLGDEERLKKTINDFLRLPDPARSAMREAAVKRSGDFSDETTVPLWLAAFDHAKRWKAGLDWKGSIRAEDGDTALSGDRLSITCGVRFDAPPALVGIPSFPITIALRERGGKDLYRANVNAVSRESDTYFRVSADWPVDILDGTKKSTYDAFVEILGANGLQSARLPTGSIGDGVDAYSTIHGNLSFRV